tara:strand:+ start:10859 stop:11848 length:990 start_codon:yes stop_codon:yes gene_type:complete
MLYKSYLIENNIGNLEKSICLFYGENIGLINELKIKIRQHEKEALFLSFNQEELVNNQDLIFNELNNLSLFDQKKIFFINQVNDKILQILKELEKSEKKQKIYVFSGPLEKKSKLRIHFEKSSTLGIIPCYPDNEITIRKIILNELKKYEGVSGNIVNFIVEKTNLDRIKLSNELSKISSFFLSKKLNQRELEMLLNERVNEDFEYLKDAALEGNLKTTNKLLSDTPLQEEKNIYYLNSINQRLIRLNEVLKIKNEEKIEKNIENLKPPIFWKDKANFIKQAKKWNSFKIEKILKKTYQIELHLKSNNLINKETLIRALIIDLCVSANA